MGLPFDPVVPAVPVRRPVARSQHRHRQWRDLPSRDRGGGRESLCERALQPCRQRAVPRRLDHAALRPARPRGSRDPDGNRAIDLSRSGGTALRLFPRQGRQPARYARRGIRRHPEHFRRPCMSIDRRNARDIKAPTGAELTCGSWQTEAPFRMIQNNLDREVAENPDELVIYGGIGRAARSWSDFEAILSSLKTLADDETLLVQSGKPVGVFRTHADAPRVLIANSNIVPHWANWDHFSELDRKGLMMYGQMTAGSWIYIGTQGIVQGTYETFVEAGRQHYGGDLNGKWILTGGLGGMGGAQPLAAVMAGACCLAVECDETRADFRIRTRYCDEKTDSLDEALAMIDRWTRAGEAKSVALIGNAGDVFPEILRRVQAGEAMANGRPDIVTDQTSAHDPYRGYLPKGWSVAEWRARQ